MLLKEQKRLKEVAEKAKIELSTALETEINLPFITSDASGPKHLLIKLTRSKFEDLVSEYISRSIELMKQALSDAKLSTSDINEIILVGGQTRMPKIQEEIKKLFGKEPNKSINPDEVVAMGAALQGAIMGGEAKEVLLLDATPLSLGIETKTEASFIFGSFFISLASSPLIALESLILLSSLEEVKSPLSKTSRPTFLSPNGPHRPRLPSCSFSAPMW